MVTAHRYLAISIIAAFLVVAVYGGLARLLRRPQVGRPFWGLQYYTETVLLVQVVVGVVLLVIGHRVPSGSLNWLHYFYGSLFPLIAVVAGRIGAIRREGAGFDYAPVALGAAVAFGLTLRAAMTGCADSPFVCLGLT
ncbi:MAG: hypothetical protein M3N57_06400 [Actinomycetota bacterium]|nr:hypothetical protein [Actinomycetota bacterium]